ncbi:MAG: efflux RND transporter periplasmic adaptor subunit, partial [candidate division Zixibacteria bacterium]
TKISSKVIARGNLTIAVNSTGVVEPIQTVELKSKASGEIIELPIEEGDIVAEGQLIARLDATTSKNNYDQAVADLQVAKSSLSLVEKEAERQARLYKQSLISELEYENALLEKERANSNLVKAKANLEDARERLSDTVIKSPIDGIVLKKFVETGQIIASGISAVSGGTTIALVADLKRAYVKTAVDEVDIGQIRADQRATIVAESYPDREFTGEVLRIHPLAREEQNVTTFDVTIEVDNVEGLLMAGMNASVEIIAGFRENVLLVPREALTDVRSLSRMAGSNGGGRPGMARSRGGQSGGMRGGSGSGHGGGMGQHPENGKKTKPMKLVIVTNNGEQEPRQIEIGLSNFEKAEVLSGLVEGDTVLTTITSKALLDREAFMERMRGWNRIPGMEKKKK